MDFKQAKLDGNDILKDSISGIYYASKEWKKLTTDDTSTNIAGYHGRKTSPTFARKRVVTLEGYIARSGNASEYQAVQYLQTLFSLQSDTSSLISRSLYIKDMYDQEWTLGVKVRDPIEFIEYSPEWKGCAWKWMVTLESVNDPAYKSYTENSVDGVEGTYGGMALGSTIPARLDTSTNFIDCATTGNSSTPARIEMTVSDTVSSPLTVRNTTAGNFFALDTNAVSGDVIIIDSNSQTVTKNGVSIKSLRIAGSVFPVISGTTRFMIEDIDGGLPLNDFSVRILFRDALLA